jgi:hypothetical protein
MRWSGVVILVVGLFDTPFQKSLSHKYHKTLPALYIPLVFWYLLNIQYIS